jgi:cyclic pyranopterin monophosphate synthase
MKSEDELSVESGLHGLSHVDARGQVAMVDVSEKSVSSRTAVAHSHIELGAEFCQRLMGNELISAKGPVFQTAKLAGILAAKRTDELIPLCHSLPLDNCDVQMEILDSQKGLIRITASAKTISRTGVEMEALMAASIAALTIYDMCKAWGHGITIGNTYLQSKTGGKNDYQRESVDSVRRPIETHGSR